MTLANQYDTLITTEEASRILGIPMMTLHHWRSQQKHLPFYQRGGKWGRVRYRLNDVLDFLEKYHDSAEGEH